MKYIITTFDGREFPITLESQEEATQLLDKKYIQTKNGIIAGSGISSIVPDNSSSAERKSTEMKRKGYKIEVEETISWMRDENGDVLIKDDRAQASVKKKHVWKRGDEIIPLTKAEIQFHFGNDYKQLN